MSDNSFIETVPNYTDLVNNIPSIKEADDKYHKPRIERNEDGTICVCLKGQKFIFDSECYELLSQYLKEGFIIKSGYLYPHVKNAKPMHRIIKNEEIMKFSKDLEYPQDEVHVHHIDSEKNDNRSSNLKVLHRDEHAKIHGYASWAQLVFHRFRAKKEIKYIID